MINGNQGWFADAIRTFFTVLDGFGYFLLSSVYDIFFTVANAQIFQGDIINSFYARIQLILGVFMIFKLALTILNIIINPDLIRDKQKGPGKIFTHLAVALILLTLIVPINIPNADGNPLNEQIRSNGILFGFLYQFQNSVIDDNILGKLILGSSTDNLSDNDNSLDLNGISSVGDTLSATVAKAFIRPNLDPDVDPDDIETDEQYQEAVLCKEEIESIDYFNPSLSSDALLDSINEECSNTYALRYTVLAGAIISVIMTIIILGFTIDVAVRAIKLAILRLIAPIPIISYITPGAEKDGAFGNWVKTLTSTYLDLFIRLAVIYFGIYLIVIISQGGIDLWQSTTNVFTSALATLFIIIGILIFIKQAPKFFKDMLGLKGTPLSNVGLSGVLGGAAALIGGAGLAGAGAAMINNLEAGAEAAAQGKSTGLGWAAGRDLAAQIRTGDPKNRGGIINRSKDRLIRASAINMARRYGVTASGLDVAKNKSIEADAQAAKSKDLYDRFLEGKASSQEIAEVAARNGIDYNSRTNTFASEAEHEKMRQTLYNYSASDATAAVKAKKSWDEAKEFAKTHRINPSFEEEHRPSFFGERRMNEKERPDMYNARGRGKTAHQNMGDRVFGSRKDWTVPNSPRTENRWNPNGDRTNIDNDTMHDNVWSPGEPGGPGPGGPGPMGPGGPPPRQ